MSEDLRRIRVDAWRLMRPTQSRANIPFLRFVAFGGPNIPIKASLIRSCSRRRESLRGLLCDIRILNP
jgi:hypothetical protein